MSTLCSSIGVGEPVLKLPAFFALPNEPSLFLLKEASREAGLLDVDESNP